MGHSENSLNVKQIRQRAAVRAPRQQIWSQPFPRWVRMLLPRATSFSIDLLNRLLNMNHTDRKTLLDVAQLCDLIQNVVLEIRWIMHFNFYAFKFFNVSLSDLWVSYGSGYTWNTLYSISYLLINIEPNVHSKKYKNTFVFWAKESVLLKNKFDVFKSFELKKKIEGFSCLGIMSHHIISRSSQ